MTKLYINPETGSVGTRDEWIYQDEDGNVIDPVADLVELEKVVDTWPTAEGFAVELDTGDILAVEGGMVILCDSDMIPNHDQSSAQELWDEVLENE